MHSSVHEDRGRVQRGTGVVDGPRFSVIVLVTERVRRLMRCLSSIQAHRPVSGALEILVVANGTPPAELELLSSREDVVLLRSSVNLGFGGGCNWAARVARAQRLVFINDDAVALSGWLDELEAVMDSDSRIGVVGSKVLLGNGTLQEVGAVMWRDGTMSGVGRGRDPRRSAFIQSRDVDYVSFASAMVRRATWDAVGGFDEAFFPAYYEDADLCFSARALGWRVVSAPRSVVVHDEGASAAPSYRRFLQRRNRVAFVAKWRDVLCEHDVAPHRLSGEAAVWRALDGTARRAAGGGVQVPPRLVGAADDAPPARGAALQAEYGEYLAQLDAAGPEGALRRRYLWLRSQGGMLLRRYPRLSDRVRRFVVSVGSRD